MATDLDSGENSRIRYLLSSRSADNYDLMFRVDELTGEIYTQESLDYEERSQYILIVVAVDSQVNGLTGETTVIVNVKDVNDNAPHIILISPNVDPEYISIKENAKLMTPIAHVSIEDPDEEMGGVVSCTVNDTKFSLTQIYANDFMLRSAEILDREMTSKFYVMITCKDRGQPELVSWKTIDINVLDVNDNRPMFGQTHYQVIISADIHIGDNISQLSATDPDEGDNGNVAYSILDPDVVHLFSINKQSGIVSANVNIPNISIWDFKIHILAEDMGDEPLSSTTILILSSLVNQSSSNIDLLSQNNVTVLHVEENWPENIKIGQLFDDNEHLVCDITTVVYPDEIKKLFVLSNNGEVIVQTSLDRETQETYYFGAIVKKVCRNSAGEQESVKGYIIQVIVDDQNDNAPIVIFPNSDNNTITLHPGLVDERLLLAKIKGTDADVEKNSRLTFTLVNPERFDYLRLNPDSGELYVIGEVRDDIESKLVRIKLTDNGSPSLSTTATLRINLTSAAVISNPETMVTADNLTKVLSITLPCSVILVLVIILIVRLTRKTFSCRNTIPVDIQKSSLDQTQQCPHLEDVIKERGADRTLKEGALSNGDKSVFVTQLDSYLKDEGEDLIGFSQQPSRNLGRMFESESSNIRELKGTALNYQDSDSGCSIDMSHSTATTESWVRIHHDLRSPNTDTYRIYSPDSDHHGQIRGHSNNDIVQYENGKQSRPQTPFYRHSQVYSSPVRLDTIRQCGHTNNNGCENSPRRDGPDPEGSASGEWLPYDSWERPSHVTGNLRHHHDKYRNASPRGPLDSGASGVARHISPNYYRTKDPNSERITTSTEMSKQNFRQKKKKIIYEAQV
ncbi:hypothetical protein LSH36_53g02017 [Paralvinella palmiformis]|uniref:Cadherin domain-containing protein n=1 Tax=Paralvinella palmiformis TaxID=53620 RepID=A0AAD9K5T0_9ANNE|nr:hypothetical protein LSH36_53g02017 [Paralvinella palmiformis]